MAWKQRLPVKVATEADETASHNAKRDMWRRHHFKIRRRRGLKTF